MTTRQLWRKYPPETVDLLFTAVDEDDCVDDSVSLPQAIDLSCSAESIRDNYALCLQYWQEGFTRAELLSLVTRVVQGETLSEQERRQYKYIRSRYKHLRFAQRLYGQQHVCSAGLSKTTVFLGRFQDAFRNENISHVTFYGRILSVCLSTPVWRWVDHALRHFPLTGESDFIACCQQEMRKLQAFIAKPRLTGREFHAVRKIVSQQVSYYDTRRALDPDDLAARQISRYLAAINGLMGDRHDEMVSGNLAGQRDYNAPEPLDAGIRQRLEHFIERYPLGAVQ